MTPGERKNCAMISCQQPHGRGGLLEVVTEYVIGFLACSERLIGTLALCYFFASRSSFVGGCFS